MNKFDNLINRKGTNSVKWDSVEEMFGMKDLLAMWVADMDFEPSKAIRDDLTNFSANEILGYVTPSESFYESIIHWFNNKHNLNLTKDNVLLSPGVISSIGAAIQAFSSEQDGILIHDPVYPPFSSIVTSNNRQLYKSELIIENGKYLMNFKDIEHYFKHNAIKLFILSNPQNPSGRVWTKDEIERLVELCLEYNVILLSDEIHSDLTYKGFNPTSPLSLGEKYYNNAVIFHSATKTFNIASTKLSLVFIKDPELIQKFQDIQAKTAQSNVNTFGLIATEAAFSKSNDWYKDLMNYLSENRQIVMDFFDQELPNVEYLPPQSTYLFWFNPETIDVPKDKLNQLFVKEGKIALNDGLSYGENGAGWLRFNFGTPKENVVEGLKRIKTVFDKHK